MVRFGNAYPSTFLLTIWMLSSLFHFSFHFLVMQLDSQHSMYRSWWRLDDLTFSCAKNSILMILILIEEILMIMIH